MSKELYYQDLSISIDKKLTQAFKLNAMYLLQQYNPKVVVKEPEDIITAHIFVLEGKYVFNPVLSLRAETQYLLASPYTGEADVTPIRRSNQGNWFFQTLELSWLPHFMFTLSDMYNAGSTREHYYKALVSFTAGAHFIQAGYGRTKAGYDCSGGVCREVPASKGFLLSYHYNF